MALTFAKAIELAYEAGACSQTLDELRLMNARNEGWKPFMEHQYCLSWIGWYMDEVKDTTIEEQGTPETYDKLYGAFSRWEVAAPHQVPEYEYACKALREAWLNYVNI